MLRQSVCERQRLVGTNTKGPSVAQGNLDAFESGNVIEPTTRRPPNTKVGTFTQALYDEAKKDGWTTSA
jgi:hypothetical protein